MAIGANLFKFRMPRLPSDVGLQTISQTNFALSTGIFVAARPKEVPTYLYYCIKRLHRDINNGERVNSLRGEDRDNKIFPSGNVEVKTSMG
jgi:hypothetical protein